MIGLKCGYDKWFEYQYPYCMYSAYTVLTFGFSQIKEIQHFVLWENCHYFYFYFGYCCSCLIFLELFWNSVQPASLVMICNNFFFFKRTCCQAFTESFLNLSFKCMLLPPHLGSTHPISGTFSSSICVCSLLTAALFCHTVPCLFCPPVWQCHLSGWDYAHQAGEEHWGLNYLLRSEIYS